MPIAVMATMRVEALRGTVDLDQQAGALDIAAGGTYRMDIFQADRPETTVACVDNVIVP